MAGFYALAAPYDKLISASAQYRCVGIKSLAAAVAEGQDPLVSVYKANGDTPASFNRDLANNVSLVSISSEAGALVVFPSTALLKLPQADGVVYRNTIMSVALGALPETQDLSELQAEVLAIVKNKYGINPAAYVSTVNAPALLTRQQHEQVLLARQGKITDDDSLVAENARLRLQVSAAQSKIEQLEAYIIEHALN